MDFPRSSENCLNLALQIRQQSHNGALSYVPKPIGDARNLLQPMLDLLMHICGCTGGDRELDRSGFFRSELYAAGALGSELLPRFRSSTACN